MSYIIKNTQSLINTRITDAGRKKLSQGKFNISYFQVGDSEVYYNNITNFIYTDGQVLSAAFNAQNKTFQPETNKGNVKYPYFVKERGGNTYGIPIDESSTTSIVNSPAPKGFFDGDYQSWTIKVDSAHTKNTKYIVDICDNCDKTTIVLSADPSCGSATSAIEVNDFITIVFDGNGACQTLSSGQPPPVLTYRVVNVALPSVELDRKLPKFCDSCCPGGFGKVYVYPSGMTVLYDTETVNCDPDVTNFTSLCNYSDIDVPVWNMNIPWKYDPAGLNSNSNAGYGEFGSISYIGTMEYLGYGSNSGQTFYANTSSPNETTDTWFRNSFDEIVKVLPEEQKCIAIVHYTNNSIDTYYGEKFVMNSNFKVSLPTLMWHKNPNGTMGETFYVDPGVGTNTFEVKYMQSTPNPDMNDPGLRYFHLWDQYPGPSGEPNRVGKVFPDLKIVVFDDEEIVAALSNKSNRNWTLPAPKLSLVPPSSTTGLLTNENEYLWVTYRFNLDDTDVLTPSLHSNYYIKIQGPQSCYTTQSQDVVVKFGEEFNFLKDCCFNGYYAESFYILAQKVSGATTQPDPTQWKLMNFTTEAGGAPITSTNMTNTTFTISTTKYNGGSIYNLGPVLNLPNPGGTELNFGDEYYFYGNIETDITATIYEMKYKINLPSGTFSFTQNPTWVSGDTYITEVGFFDSEKDLMVTSKFQSPILRQGSQQLSISLDF